MVELLPCVACDRHVAVHETRCPFCATALAPRGARRTVSRGFSRAAVLSAALASCSSPKDSEVKPAPPSTQQGSDDLERLLDPSTVPREPRAAIADAGVMDTALAGAAIDAAVVAAAVDAGLPLDAGVAKRRERKRREEVVPDPDLVPIEDERRLAKPYGAPPARRRVV